MGTFTENPRARITILWNKRRTNVDLWSKCWFGTDVGDGHFYRESLRENDNPMKHETHKCRFLIKMLIWCWRWRWALLQRILVRERQSYETRDALMYIFDKNVDLALTLAMGTFTENPCAKITILWSKRRTNIDFSFKCWFGVDVGDVGASKRILVREWEFHCEFWPEMCFCYEKSWFFIGKM